MSKNIILELDHKTIFLIFFFNHFIVFASIKNETYLYLKKYILGTMLLQKFLPNSKSIGKCWKTLL